MYANELHTRHRGGAFRSALVTVALVPGKDFAPPYDKPTPILLCRRLPCVCCGWRVTCTCPCLVFLIPSQLVVPIFFMVDALFFFFILRLASLRCFAHSNRVIYTVDDGVHFRMAKGKGGSLSKLALGTQEFSLLSLAQVCVCVCV